MSLPLSLAEYRLIEMRKAHEITSLHQCKDDLIFIKNYRTFEYYKRIDDRFVFARKLLPREVEDFYFNNGRSFRGCTIVEKFK